MGKAAHVGVGRLIPLGDLGNWPRKGVMPMKWLVVRPDTSKPPARRITSPHALPAALMVF